MTGAEIGVLILAAAGIAYGYNQHKLIQRVTSLQMHCLSMCKTIEELEVRTHKLEMERLERQNA